jgi:hypothetical protein
MRKPSVVPAAAVALFLVDVLLFFYPVGGTLLSSIVITLTSLLTISLGYYAFRLHGFNNKYGKALFFFAANSTTASMGVWMFNAQIMATGNTVPPLVSGFLWLLSHAFLVVGSFFVMSMFGMPSDRRKRGAVLAVCAATALGVLYLLTIGAGDIIIPLPLIYAYLISDMLVLDMLAVIVASSYGSKLFRIWGLLLAGMFAFTVTAAYFSVQPSGPFGPYATLLLTFTYTLFSLGYFYSRKLMESPYKR